MRIILIIAAVVGVVLAYRHHIPYLMPFSIAGLTLGTLPVSLRHKSAEVIPVEPPAAVAPAAVPRKKVV